MLAITKPVETALARACDAWHLRLDKLSFERHGDASAKTESLKSILVTYAQKSVTHLIAACRSRQRLFELLKRQHSSRFATVELVLESKLLLHLGRANVLENVGLYADRTTGLPVVPGTALKGVLSTWACWEANQRSDGSFKEGQDFLELRSQFDSSMARRVFGDNSPDGSEHGGEVVFLGGFPNTPPVLGLDIVNPHYDVQGRENERLTPNTFLCVEPGSLWKFGFLARSGSAEPAKLLEAVSAWLSQALTQLGIGAKTASGYGRFRPLNESDRLAQAKKVEQSNAAAASAAAKAKSDAAIARQKAAAEAALKSDYPNEATYKNTVLRLADNPGQWSALQREIERLKKPGNAIWLDRFKQDTAGRSYRKLREQPWYPK